MVTDDRLVRLASRFFVVAFFVLCFLTRLVPGLEDDRGIFVSVGERLLAGDGLYAEVYDNKDPVFYYLMAAQRLAGPLAQYLFELGWVLLASVSVYHLAAKLGLNGLVRAATAFAAAPLLVTGAFYSPGYTNLPGTALSLLACAFYVGGRPVLAGAAVGLLLFVKLIVAPLPVVFCLVYAAANGAARRGVRRVLAGGAGLLLAVAAVVLFMSLRGELVAYSTAQVRNVQYSQGSLADNTSAWALVSSHLRAMFLDGARQRTLALATLAAAVLAALGVRRGRQSSESRAVACASIATTIASVAVVGVTGIWPNHVQVMYLSGTLLVVSVASHWIGHAPRGPLTVAIVLAAELLSGGIGFRRYLADPRDFPNTLQALRTLSPEAVALVTESNGVPGTYARLGANDDRGHAYGLRQYDLACPEFHQYFFYSNSRLDEALECASRAQFLLVAPSLESWATPPEWLPRYANRSLAVETWNAYVQKVEDVLLMRFRCRRIEPEGIRVCKREH